MVCGLAGAAPASAATPVVLGKGPGGLLALDAADGSAYAVIGRSDAQRPFGLLRSSGRGAGSTSAFGAVSGRDPDLLAFPGGIAVTWARVVTSGMEYSTAPVTRQGVGAPELLGSGTGPPKLGFASGRLEIARPDAAGNVALGERTLTSDAPDLRHLPLDVAATTTGAVLVLDLAQRQAASTLRVLGPPEAPTAPIVATNDLEDLEGSLAIDGNRVYVGFLRNARAYLATATLAPDARWSVRRLPGPGGGEGAPAVARAGGRTYVAYAQGARRRDIYLARIDQHTRVTHLSDDPRDDTRPKIAASGDGTVFVGWTRERRGAKTGTALLVKTD